VIQPIETQEDRLNEEPRLCVVRRSEGLIENASWVKGKRDGLRLVVVVLIATGLFGKRGQ